MKLRISDINKVYYIIQKGLSEYQANLHCICNKYVNIASTDQVNYVLVKELNLFNKPPKTLDLQSCKDKHPIIPLVLEYRSLYSLSSQWIDFLHNYCINNKENKEKENDNEVEKDNENSDYVVLHVFILIIILLAIISSFHFNRKIIFLQSQYSSSSSYDRIYKS